MNKKLVIMAMTAMAVMAASTAAYANSGTGMEADSSASLMEQKGMVSCKEDVEFKTYINDEDKVLVTYPAGTIFEMDSVLLRDGKETGWGETMVKDVANGGLTSGFFDRDKVTAYNVPDGVEVEVNTNNGMVVVVRLPIMEEGEQFDYEIADQSVIQHLTGGEDNGKQFAISYMLTEGTTTDSSVLFTGHVKDEAVAKYRLNVYPDGSALVATVTELPRDYEAGSDPAAAENSQKQEKEKETEARAEVVNDNLYCVKESEMTTKTGIDLPAPKTAEAVAFNILTPSAQFPIAELQCTYGAHQISERGQYTQVVKLDENTKEEDFNISGYYYTWDSIEPCEVTRRPAVVCRCKDATVIAWLDVVPGIMYNIAVPEELENSEMVELAETFFAPLQGEA